MVDRRRAVQVATPEVLANADSTVTLFCKHDPNTASARSLRCGGQCCTISYLLTLHPLNHPPYQPVRLLCCRILQPNIRRLRKSGRVRRTGPSPRARPRAARDTGSAPGTHPRTRRRTRTAAGALTAAIIANIEVPRIWRQRPNDAPRTIRVMLVHLTIPPWAMSTCPPKRNRAVPF